MSEQAQGAQPQDQPQTPAAPAATGPWAQDIAAIFTDPEIQTQVNAFLGEKVQPYVTQKEQEAAALRDKANLYDAFEQDAGSAYLALSEELFGEEGKNAVLAALQGSITDEPEAQGPETDHEVPAPPGGEPPEVLNEDLEWVRQFRAQKEAEEARAEYEQAVDALIAENGHVNKTAFAPFVVTAGGDLDAALAGYNEWCKEVGLPDGSAPPPDPAPVTVADPGTTPPVTVKDYGGNLDAAIDDAFADIAPPAPPTV